MAAVTKEAFHDALVLRHGKDLQGKIDHATVAVCGLGGLGSNIATALARTGIGHLILLDFDRVDVTNLHRQQYRISQVGQPKAFAMAENLKEVNPFIQVEAHNIRLTTDNMRELLQGADFICEAFDNPEAKAMLADFVLEQLPKAYLIAASGMAGLGSANDIQTRKITGHFYLCGDGKSDVSDGLGLVASRAMVCAAHQAHMVIRLLAQETTP